MLSRRTSEEASRRMSNKSNKSSKMSSGSVILTEQEANALTEIELEMAKEEDANVQEDTNNNTEAPNLEAAMIEVRKCTDLFFNNKFDEAMEIFAKQEHSSLIHSLGKSYLLTVYAVLTLEPDDLKRALESIKATNSLVNKRRKRTSLLTNVSNLIWRTTYEDYNDEEVHAELMYAEVQIMLTILSLSEQGSLISLVKGAFRMRASNNVYKFCMDILKRRTNWGSEMIKDEFECGVLLGIGTINLVLSHMPTRVLKVLSFVGFGGDQDLAMTSLRRVTDDLTDTNRSGTGQLVVMGYLLYMEQIFGAGDVSDPGWADRLAAGLLAKYPQGAWGLLYSGRLQQIKGHPEKAIPCLQACLSSQSVWANIHNICYWDMAWCHAALGQWEMAAKYSKTLAEQCNWSPATNMYQHACFLYAMMEETTDQSEKARLLAEVDVAMARVPELKIRYGGKTIPPEKFAITKATRYNEGDKDLTFPVLELFYIWNLYQYTTESSEYLKPLLKQLEEKLVHYENTLGDDEPADKMAVVLLLTGICRRHTGQSDAAIECFHKILELSERIELETYVPPHAAFELGLTYARLGQNDDAVKWLEAAKSDYTGFLIESAVHLRVHGALTAIKRKRKSNKRNSKDKIEVDIPEMTKC